jgi:hypothetical protein
VQDYIVRRGMLNGAKVKIVDKIFDGKTVLSELQSKSKIENMVIKCIYIQTNQYRYKMMGEPISQFIEICIMDKNVETKKYQIYAQSDRYTFNGVKLIKGNERIVISQYNIQEFEKFRNIIKRIRKGDDVFTSDFVMKTLKVAMGKEKFYHIPEYIQQAKDQLEITASNIT